MSGLTIGQRISAARTKRSAAVTALRDASSKAHPYSLGRSVWQEEDDRRLQHAEQTQHYQGRAYSVINVNIARISAQPVLVARKRATGVSTPFGKRYSMKALVRRGELDPKTVPKWVTKNPSLAEDMEVLPEHGILDVIDRPNPMMTRSNLWEMTLASMDVTGLAYWMLWQSQGQIRILPLPAHWVLPVHAVDGSSLFERFDVAPYDAIERPIQVKAQDMARFAYCDPFDPLGVISPLQKQARSILASEYIEEAQAASFKNALRPSLAVYTGSENPGDIELNDTQRKQIMDWLKAEYAGALKVGGALVLDSIIRDVKPLLNNPAEMDFPNSSQMVAENIHEGFATSRIITGNDQNANRAGSATAEHHWTANRANPVITRLGEVLTAQVAPWFSSEGEELRVWVEPIEPHDPQLQLSKMQKAYADGVTTVNQYLQFLGLPPVEGGDVIMVPQGKVPVRIEEFEEWVDKAQEQAMPEPQPEMDLAGLLGGPGQPGQPGEGSTAPGKPQGGRPDNGRPDGTDDELGFLIRCAEYWQKHRPGGHDHDQSTHGNRGDTAVAPPKFEHSSTQVNIEDPQILKRLDALQEKIAPEDVVERETSPHVTVLFGLHTENSDEAAPLVSIPESKSLTFGTLGLFEGEERDVLYVSVKSNDLQQLREGLSELPHTSTHPTYRPHMTVAFLQPGTARKYIGIETGLEGQTYRFREIVFSTPHRVQTPLKQLEAWLLKYLIGPKHKAFCPTGDGGGVDNSCSPTGRPATSDPGRRDTEWSRGHAREQLGEFADKEESLKGRISEVSKEIRHLENEHSEARHADSPEQEKIADELEAMIQQKRSMERQLFNLRQEWMFAELSQAEAWDAMGDDGLLLSAPHGNPALHAALLGDPGVYGEGNGVPVEINAHGKVTASKTQRGMAKQQVVSEVGGRIDMAADHFAVIAANDDVAWVTDELTLTEDLADIRDRLAKKTGHSGLGRDNGEDIVQEHLNAWAASSSNGNPVSGALQLAVAKKFGDTQGVHSLRPDAARLAQLLYERNETVYDQMVDAIYENTQERLARHGVEKVVLYRGMVLDEAELPTRLVNGSASGEFDMDLNPVSSFSTEFKTSVSFSDPDVKVEKVGMVAALVVPRERIFSLATTGPGCFTEGEVLVTGEDPLHGVFYALGDVGSYRPLDDEQSFFEEVARAKNAKSRKQTARVNADAALGNADWPKRTPDRIADLQDGNEPTEGADA